MRERLLEEVNWTWNTAGAAAKSLQSCPTLCDPIDGSPPGSPVPGILHGTMDWFKIGKGGKEYVKVVY